MFDRLLHRPDVEERLVLGSPVGFLALHGGLEGGTEAIATRAAAATGASAYVVTQPRTLGWHVSSHRVDPDRVPRLAAFLDHVDVVVSVHGYFRPELADAVFVGGGNRSLARTVASGLRVEIDEMPVVDSVHAIPRAMRGIDPRNPVNRSRGGGVQIELPHRARTDTPRADGGPSVAARVTAVLIEAARSLARERAA